jgi:prevent-host-death family protein
MKEIPLSEVKDDLSRFLREAAKQDIVITRQGKPAGVLVGFESEDDWFEHRPRARPALPCKDRASPEEHPRPERHPAGRPLSRQTVDPARAFMP